MHGDNLDDLNRFAPKMVEQLKTIPIISDVNSDQQNCGLQTMIQYDRGTSARFGITPQLIDNTLYDAFGQRQVSTMYTSLNQYHVVMEASPEFWQNPLFLSQIYVDSPSGQQVPLSAFAKFASTTAPLTVTHQGLFPAVTISFNLKPGVALGDAVNAATAAAAKVGLPATIQTEFAGTAQAYEASLASEPILIAAALVTVYLILAMLYESYIHPITIISSLPAASVGAVLALLITHNDLKYYCDHRHNFTHWDREKERHHDDRFRSGRLATRRQELTRLHRRSLHVALPPNSDDHDGRAPGSFAARTGNRHWIRTSPSSGHYDYRRADYEPIADVIYDTCGLSVL